MLGWCVTLGGGLPIPVDSFRIILWHALALVVQDAQVILRFGLTLFS